MRGRTKSLMDYLSVARTAEVRVTPRFLFKFNLIRETRVLPSGPMEFGPDDVSLETDR